MREERRESEWILSCQEFQVKLGMHQGSVLSPFFLQLWLLLLARLINCQFVVFLGFGRRSP